MPLFHLTLVRPPEYGHSECFREVAEGLQSAFRTLGHAASIGENTLDPKATNVLFGAHLLSKEEAAALPGNAVVYNLEQLGAAGLPAWYMEIASRVRVWDYSEINLAHWARVLSREPARLVEIGFAPELCRVPEAPVQDIDVLFYGSLNERRAHILRSLQAAGVRVHHAFGVYGAERDALIARAKLVLNVHHYDSKIFEIVRVSYLLANGKAVVTETSPDLGALAEAVAPFDYDSLVPGCLALLANEEARKNLGERARTLFSARDQAALLRRALEAEPAPRQPATRPSYPRRLNLGSGKDWRADCLNIDINDYWRPDAVLDISQPLPERIELATERFGAIAIEPGSFDEILANDVLEHIPNLTAAMSCALRLLRPGGLFQISVPYDLSLGAWQDPTHVRAFNERSWLYYTDWFWYLSWTEARFTVDKLDFALSPLGEKLKSKLEGEELVRTPRAVDSMKVSLRKQLLNAAERQFVLGYLQRPDRSGSPSRQQPIREQEPVGAASV